MRQKSQTGKRHRSIAWRTCLAVFLFIAVAFLAATMPDRPAALQIGSFLRLPLEIPLTMLALLLLPKRLALIFAIIPLIAAASLLFLKLADLGVQSAFQRRFNPYLDLKMLTDGWNLLSGTVGTWTAALTIAAAAGAFLILLAIFLWSQRQIVFLEAPAKRRLAVIFGGVLLLGGAIWLAAPWLGVRGFAEAKTIPYLNARVKLVTKSMADMRRFEEALVAPELQTRPARFEAIRGRDVIIIFVESYGRSAVEDPQYRNLIQPRLAAVEERLASEGYSAASGWTKSPTVGGLSWLAHGTFLSGLWVDSQARYDRLMISRRPSLNRLFREAGWQTTAVMPAITMDWPEAAYFGYGQILAAGNLGYRGKPFNWVTMPDQYTLSAFERLARQPAKAAGKPVMAEIALISSHAPWTPVPSLIGWDGIGDGTVFNTQAESGDPPATVWANPEGIRQHYIRTIDYSLETLGDYIARFGGDGIFIILGDHQPAPVITGQNASRAVPVHVISRDRTLIRRFEEDGFAGGMTPETDAAEWPMDSMRDRLMRIFSGS